jgi:hypothetical protein
MKESEPRGIRRWRPPSRLTTRSSSIMTTMTEEGASKSTFPEGRIPKMENSENENSDTDYREDSEIPSTGK